MKYVQWSKNIGVDFDDVIIDTFKAVLNHHDNKLGGKQLEYNQVTHFYLNKILGFDHVPLQDCIDYFNKALIIPSFHDSLKPIQDALDVCTYLKDQGHKLYIITARPKDLQDNMISWLDSHGVSSIFDDSIFLEHKDHGSDITKSSVCKDLDIHVMIEDAAHNAEKLAQENIMTFVPRRPWNRNVKNGEHIITVGNHCEDNARQEIKGIYQATY